MTKPKSEAIELAIMQAKENDKTRILSIVLSPPVLGMAMVAGGLILANKVTWDSKDPSRNADVRAVIGAAAIMAGLSTAGVKDRWLLGVAGAAAGLSGLQGVSDPVAGEVALVGAATAAGIVAGEAIFPVGGGLVGGALLGGAASLYEGLKK